MRLSDAREQYVRWLRATRDTSPHTVRAYACDIRSFERYVGASIDVATIEATHVIAFLEACRAEGRAAASIRRTASGIRGFCRWLVLTGALAVDPWVGTPVNAGRGRRLPRVVPGPELERLVASLRTAACVPRSRVDNGELSRPHEATTLLLVALLIATGLRIGEAVEVRVHDIDLASRAVRVMGKGRRERRVFLTSPWLTSLASSYLTTRTALPVAHDRVFFDRRWQPLTTAAARLRLRHAGRAANLTTAVTPHMLRHTAATQLIEAGVDIRYIQRLLGHASLTTTELYTHVSDVSLKRVVSDADVLGRALGSDN